MSPDVVVTNCPCWRADWNWHQAPSPRCPEACNEHECHEHSDGKHHGDKLRADVCLCGTPVTA